MLSENTSMEIVCKCFFFASSSLSTNHKLNLMNKLLLKIAYDESNVLVAYMNRMRVLMCVFYAIEMSVFVFAWFYEILRSGWIEWNKRAKNNYHNHNDIKIKKKIDDGMQANICIYCIQLIREEFFSLFFSIITMLTSLIMLRTCSLIQVFQ